MNSDGSRVGNEDVVALSGEACGQGDARAGEDPGAAKEDGDASSWKTMEEAFSWEHEVKAEPWPEPVDGGQLLDELTGLVKRYVVLPKFAAETLALWALHTYAFRLRDVTTYIGVESPEKRCGKTTLLTMMSELVDRPVVASNISSSAFFRVIEEKEPTLLIDEADTVLHRNDELRGILNSGYRRRTAYVVRVTAGERKSGVEKRRGDHKEAREGEESVEASERGTGKGGTRLARYSCWCPKMIATIQHLPETLADRCIVIGMYRKSAEEKCERLKSLRGKDLRRKCARFVKDHAEEIAGRQPEVPEDLNDRAADIWEPLLVLSELVGGQWAERARESALGLSAGRQEESPTGALLFDILMSFLKSQSERMFSRTLVSELNGLGERPWAEIRKGRGVTEQWLARQLRQYGVRSQTMWIGETAAKGYRRDDFKEVFARYIPKRQAKELFEEMIEPRAPTSQETGLAEGSAAVAGPT